MPSTSSASSTATDNACYIAFESWANGPHGTALQHVGTASGSVATDLLQVVNSGYASSAVTTAFNAGGALGIDAYHALQNPPPSCVPGLAGPYKTAMAETRQAGIDLLEAMTALRIGNQSVALSSIKAFSTEIGKAQNSISTVTNTVSSYNASSGG